MSDSEGDFSDELLELAGATEKKRRKRQPQAKPMKRKRTSGELSDLDSENVQTANEDENENPYPLDGKYVDEEDRERLLSMSEIEREGLLAQRQEELQRIQDKRNLDQMFRDRTGGVDDAVAKAAKRQHAQRGATKEKSRKLDELKAKRKANREKKRTRTDSPRRERSSSPVDMEMSDEEEEDGQISKFEEEEKERVQDKSKVDDGPITIEDLRKARLTRDILAKHWRKPWFEDLVKGSWVRYSCAFDQERQSSIYRICEVIQLLPKIVKEYPLNDRAADQEILLRHGDQEKAWPMDKVSNGDFTEKEFQKLNVALEGAGHTLPTRRELEKKAAQIDKIQNQSLTEADINTMLAMKLKHKAAGRPSAAALTLERSRLNQARTLALRRKDFDEVAELDAQLAALTGTVSQTDAPAPSETETANAREQRDKLKAIRDAEQAELARRWEERRKRLLAAKDEGTATPPPSRLVGLGALDSRQGTPGTPAKTGTPANESERKFKLDFETTVLDSVEIDLGDF